MENRGSEDDEMFGGVWQAMEASTRKTKMREAERKRSKRGSRKKKGREG